MEASGVPTGERAALVSRNFNASIGRCLTFWYHMYGEAMGELNVYVKPVGRNRTKIWSKSGDQGDEWKMGQVTLKNMDSDYQVKPRFRVQSGNFFMYFEEGYRGVNYTRTTIFFYYV